MMIITVARMKSTSDETLGILFVDGKKEGYTLEDEYREEKVYGETRIPAGTYRVKLRREGGYYARFSSRFGSDHPIIWLQDVPEFKWIYIHPGNTDDDTNGCILVGEDYSHRRTSKKETINILNSTPVYLGIHEKVVKAIEQDMEEVFVNVVDLDKGIDG